MTFEPWRQGAEVLTWRLVAALATRTRVDRVVEMHPGDGQYDMVEIHFGAQPGDGRGPVYLDCNRPGRVHITTGERWCEPRDLLGDLEHGMPLEAAVHWVVDAAGLTEAPVDDSVAATFGLMAAAIATGAGLLDGRSWEWRNGRLDASDAAGRRDDFFRAVPGADRASTPVAGDLLGLPEFRFWFLLADGLPLVAVEPTRGRIYIDAGAHDVREPETEARWRHAVMGRAGPEPFSGTPAERVAAARQAFRPVAGHLAARLAPDLIAFKPGPELSARAEWFDDHAGTVLVVVVGAHETVDVSDEILAYALAWQGDRDLVLVLPATHVGLTLERLAWIETPVRVFTYEADLEPRPEIVPSRAEVLARASLLPLRPTETHDLDDCATFVDPLTRRLDRHWALVPAHRSSYLAWHCLGRQVLRIARTTTGVTVLAGVAYGKPPPGEEKALVLSLTGELSPVQLAEVERRVADAVWKRLAGHDPGHVEHRMQAALASTGLAGLDVTDFRREYPAWRGAGRPGFIDFLAIDRRNVLHIVETKVGTADVKGVLQSLDYATWVTVHADEIRADLGWPLASRPGPETVVLDFVLAPKGSGVAIGPYLAGQLEALAGSVPWRVVMVADPLADIPELQGPWRRTLPPPGPLVAAPVQGPRWAASTGQELAAEQP